MADDYEAQERERIVAASGSGGSAQGWPPGMAGPRFDQDVFGGAGAALQDDDGNPLVAKKCPGRTWTGGSWHDCLGSHIWTDADAVRCYCEGPGG